jgi:hypothetical protein
MFNLHRHNYNKNRILNTALKYHHYNKELQIKKKKFILPELNQAIPPIKIKNFK